MHILKRFYSSLTSSAWIALIFCVFILAWISAAFQAPVCRCWPLKILGTALGVGGYTLFSFSLVLATRWKKLEDWLGGLDQIYHLHRKLGIWGFWLILLHPFIEALKWLPNRVEKFIFFIFPIHGRLSVNLGSYAFWLMMLILGITFLKVLPYKQWKSVHRWMSLVFILASFHIILSDKRVGSALGQFLLYFPMGLGFLAIIYKQIYLPFFARQQACVVAGVKQLTDNIVEVVLIPQKIPLSFNPGQYGFFTFFAPALTKESHPFTLIESKDSSSISLLIKARGDYTVNLYQKIKMGDRCTFEGPYGRLDYRKGGSLQIWIAGGIGVVPFIAWIRAMKEKEMKGIKIDFYYCIHRQVDAVFFNEFQAFSKSNPKFRVFLCCSETGNRLDINEILANCGEITHRQVFMCGPLSLTRDLKTKFQACGISPDHIFVEDFEFF